MSWGLIPGIISLLADRRAYIRGFISVVAYIRGGLYPGDLYPGGLKRGISRSFIMTFSSDLQLCFCLFVLQES